MEARPRLDHSDKARLYKGLAEAAESLLEVDWLCNLANFSALIMSELPDLNWAGFYLFKENQLVLGPFQGLPACLRIPIGKGVCGTAAARRETVIVEDVDQFPGHIACDSRSRSEIVVPLIHENRLLGVLDVDAPVLARFDAQDREGLESLVGILLKKSRWPAQFY